jgi:hypothetical protein
MTNPKPMDPERRKELISQAWTLPRYVLCPMISELVADRDYQAARADEAESKAEQVEELYADTLSDLGREIREKGLAVQRADAAEAARDGERAARLEAEVDRLRAALEHIAVGNLSPCITFAERILAGASIEEAHRANVAGWKR